MTCNYVTCICSDSFPSTGFNTLAQTEPKSTFPNLIGPISDSLSKGIIRNTGLNYSI